MSSASSQVEVRNGLFLRENVSIEDEATWAFLQKKIQELAKRAGVWKHAWGNGFLWAKYDEEKVAYYTLDAFDDLWSQVTMDKPSHEGCSGFFVPSDMLREMFDFLGVMKCDLCEMDPLLEGDGLWMPISALHLESLLKILILIWKCRDGKPSKKEPGSVERCQAFGTIWTRSDTLMVLPSKLTAGGDLQDVLDSFLQENWIDLGEYMELQSRTFLGCRETSFDFPKEEVVHPTISDTLSWAQQNVEKELQERCVGLVLRQICQMMSLIEFSGRRPSEWEPEVGKFVSLSLNDGMVGFCFFDERHGGRSVDVIRESVCGDFHAGFFLGSSLKGSFLCMGKIRWPIMLHIMLLPFMKMNWVVMIPFLRNMKRKCDTPF